MNPHTLRLIYIIIQLLAIILLSIELVFVFIQKPSKIQRDLIFVLLFLAIAVESYIIELQGKDANTSFIGLTLGFVCKTISNAASLWLLVNYAHINIKKKYAVGYITYFSILLILLLTTNFHKLFYVSYSYNPDSLGSPLDLVRGPLFYVYIISSAISYLGYVSIVIYEYVFSKNKQTKKINTLLLLSMSFTMIGLVLYLLKLTYGLDTALIGSELGTICLLILFTKYDFFNSLSLGLDRTMDNSKNALIILNAKDNIQYFNKTALDIVDGLSHTLSHKKENMIIEQLESFENNSNIFINNQVYKLNVTTSFSKNKNYYLGKTFDFKNVTDVYNYSKRLELDVENKTKEIVSIQKEILKSLANLIESRDGYTGKHVFNVSYSSKLIAIELSKTSKYKDIIDKHYIDMIEELSALHDVGKIKISDTILNKPGSLVGDELINMQEHSAYGAKIIKDSLTNIERKESVDMAYDIAYYHHEWFDGNGYPTKIKGYDIPLSARIVAVADVYDALRSVRSYKESFSKDKSISIIKKQTGTHFDPDIVDAFLKVVEKIEKGG